MKALPIPTGQCSLVVGHSGYYIPAFGPLIVILPKTKYINICSTHFQEITNKVPYLKKLIKIRVSL